MKLSVLTSAFNSSSFLMCCLKSVHAQIKDIHNLSHFVVDAASLDGSVELLEEWKKKCPDFFSFLSEPDQGQSDGFNKAVALSDSEWICWLNADDELAPGAIAAFREALKKNPDADIIYGHVMFINEQSQPVKIAYTLPYHYWLIRNGVWLPPSSGTFFRRELFVREPLDVNYHYVMDVEWFLRAGKNLKAVLVDQVFSRFRISSQGKTSNMIQTGAITVRHQEERERYRQKYIYSQWPNLSKVQAERRFARRQKYAKIIYYWLKSRFLLRYMRQRLLR